ncbi:MAG TPA: hypothetical protein VFP49_09360 [Nitrososphaeraceae archaeon]|nr:hypothetical protein [Nitrososphaeraceae archaeon]
MYLFYYSFFSLFLCICIITSLTIFSFVDNQFYAFAHLLNATRIQEITDNSDGIKIQFTYEPEKHIIDTFTKLYFSVQDLEGNHIKDVKASVIVTNGQRLFKFQNITATDGDFNVEYIFPDDGTHQVITRIDTKTSIIPASFSVFVPHQAPPSMLNPFPLSPDGKYSLGIIVSIILAIAIPIIAVISLIIVIKKR